MFRIIMLAIALWIGSTCKNHKCKWDLCPYKEIVRLEWDGCIIEYTQTERSTDAYRVDSIHLEHPTWEYDSIDSLLSTIK